jgi:membrane-associated PAP2 superfamily phosphatase
MPSALTAAPVSWRRDLQLTAAMGVALLLWDAAGLDLAVTRLFATTQGFAWRDHWLTSGVLHEGGRAAGWLILIALIVNLWRPFFSGPTRPERIRWVLLTLACVILVPALKRVSATSCPWDLAEFGGMAQYVSHWRFGLADGGPGHCFPSGHATAAFAFLSGFVVLRKSRPDLARQWLAGVVVVGVVYGVAQMARGAHYPSHTLWSAFACWVICMLGAPRRRNAPSG